ncbi:hypothetical protein CTI12_AA088710 [Artemisia annua]|uniref:NADH dehydrogenase [ubiquinone] iron-sulfur protein 5 n=1 Tax=Artemisia annua TaxID=35608 RepID=A0A2U1Q0V1_ARTAN|nr:hypothetical protein CTI12_AA088710 [Artemisia annua]
MASGWGITGNKGRCYDFWMDFSECMSRCREPKDCGLLREDYLECLHHSKEVFLVLLLSLFHGFVLLQFITSSSSRATICDIDFYKLLLEELYEEYSLHNLEKYRHVVGISCPFLDWMCDIPYRQARLEVFSHGCNLHWDPSFILLRLEKYTRSSRKHKLQRVSAS